MTINYNIFYLCKGETYGWAVILDFIDVLNKKPQSVFFNAALHWTYDVKEDLAGVDSVQQLTHMVLLIKH